MSFNVNLFFFVLSACVLQACRVNSLCSPCHNGQMDGTTCRCFPGWMGDSCQYCGGRIRLNDTSGTIVSQIGEEYASNMKCMWFLETERTDYSIHVSFDLLETECGWDYLYLFNGDSIRSQRIAAFSGSVLPGKLVGDPVVGGNSTGGSVLPAAECEEVREYRGDQPLQLSLQGSALLYFFTDAAAHARGFRFTYWTDCSHNCSGRGVCDSGSQCACDAGWTGELCQTALCPNNCSLNGLCSPASNSCLCQEPYTGADCSVDSRYLHWEPVGGAVFGPVMVVENNTVSSVGLEGGPREIQRAGHSAVLHEGAVWVFGGYTFADETLVVDLEYLVLNYNLTTKTWSSFVYLEEKAAAATTTPPPTVASANASLENDTAMSNSSSSAPPPTPPAVPSRPSARFGHSAVVHQDVMYVFGGELSDGTISNQLWAFNLTSLSWTLLAPTTTGASSSSGPASLPLAVKDHTAHAVNGRMVVIWGYSEHTLSPTTQLVQEYDFDTGAWSVPEMGGEVVPAAFGHASVYSQRTGLVYVVGGGSRVASYQPSTGQWARLPSLPVPLSLHSAVLLGSSIVVYGGRSLTSTDVCFRGDVLLYSIVCGEWYNTTAAGGGASSVEGLAEGVRSRYAHSALLTPTGSVLTFGGFNGLLHSDLSELLAPDCPAFVSPEDCHNRTLFGLCAWSLDLGRCLPASFDHFNCSGPVDSCSVHTDCALCTGNSSGECHWSSSSGLCLTIPTTANSTRPCPDRSACSEGACPVAVGNCFRYTSSCLDCEAAGCLFSSARGCVSGPSSNTSRCGAGRVCSSRSSCAECGASAGCLWCPSLQRCTPSNGGGAANVQYSTTYPFGQCLGWEQNEGCPPNSCSEHQTCGDCRGDPRCGWCEEESQTGLGVCSDGGFNGDLGRECQSQFWHFDDCPLCQCNGRSLCENGSSVCLDCADNTTGENCQICEEGLFGNPVNNQTECQACFCNGFAETCNATSGICPCNESGIVGATCDRCNESYGGENPLEEFCALPFFLRNEEQFTRIVSITRDANYFLIIPLLDRLVSLDIAITNPTANVSLTFRVLHGSINGGLLNRSVSPFNVYSGALNAAVPRSSESVKEGEFGNGDTAMLLEVIKTGPDFILTLSFRLDAESDLLIAFLVFTGTFVVCLTVMLAVLGVFWYGFRFYDRQRRIRRHRREMRRRVARPFATVKALVHRENGLKQQQQVGYIGVEPMEGTKAAVVSVIVQLPGHPETGRPRKEQTGICLGSALVKIKPKQTQNTPKKAGLFKRKKKASSEASSSTAEQSSGRTTLQRELTTRM